VIRATALNTPSSPVSRLARRPEVSPCRRVAWSPGDQVDMGVHDGLPRILAAVHSHVEPSYGRVTSLDSGSENAEQVVGVDPLPLHHAEQVGRVPAANHQKMPIGDRMPVLDRNCRLALLDDPSLDPGLAEIAVWDGLALGLDSEVGRIPVAPGSVGLVTEVLRSC
jgi:hypothetical protein